MVSNGMHESVGSAFEVKLVVFTKVTMKISVYCDVQVCSQCSASRSVSTVMYRSVASAVQVGAMCTKITHPCVACVELPWFGTNSF